MDSSGQLQEKLKGLKDRLNRDVFLTLLRHETILGFKNYLLLAWIIVSLFLSMLFIMGTYDNPDPNIEEAFPIKLTLYFLIFFGSIIALGYASTTIAGEVGGIADSLLSKAVKRWQYLLSKFVSQMIIFCAVYFFIISVVLLVLWKLEYFDSDFNFSGLAFIVIMMALVLIFYTSLGVMFSTFFNKTSYAFLAGLMVWFVLIFFFTIANWSFIYSPADILDHIPQILDKTWDVDYWKIVAFYMVSPFLFISLSVTYFYQRDL